MIDYIFKVQGVAQLSRVPASSESSAVAKMERYTKNYKLKFELVGKGHQKGVTSVYPDMELISPEARKSLKRRKKRS